MPADGVPQREQQESQSENQTCQDTLNSNDSTTPLASSFGQQKKVI